MIVIVGGIIVLFIYAASLSNEEKILSTKLSSFFLPLFAILALTAVLPTQVRLSGTEVSLMFSAPLRASNIALIYLLTALLVVVKGMELFKGRIVKKF